MQTPFKTLIIKFICIFSVIVVFCLPLTGCGQKHKLSGKYIYKAGDQTIEFAQTAHTFVWTANGQEFNGAYRWDDGCYRLEFYESGDLFAVSYEATVNGNSLIVNGGQFDNVSFERE